MARFTMIGLKALDPKMTELEKLIQAQAELIQHHEQRISASENK